MICKREMYGTERAEAVAFTRWRGSPLHSGKIGTNGRGDAGGEDLILFIWRITVEPAGWRVVANTPLIDPVALYIVTFCVRFCSLTV